LMWSVGYWNFPIPTSKSANLLSAVSCSMLCLEARTLASCSKNLRDLVDSL
jgi:hypothetical protein